MSWIITFFFVALLCAGFWLVGGAVAANSAEAAEGRRQRRRWVRRAALGIFGLWFVVHTLSASFHQIEAGHVGVVRTFGEITRQVPEGLQFTAPWQTVEIESLQVQARSFTLASATDESAEIQIQAILNFKVDVRAVQQLHREVGTRWFEIIVAPRVASLFKDETKNFRLEDILASREVIRRNVSSALNGEMAPFSIEVVDLLITNIELPVDFRLEVERKLAREQAVKTAQFDKARRIAVAEAEEQEIIIQARGLAEANELLGESLTPTLLQWQALQKLAPNVRIALIPAGEGIILDPTTLLGDLNQIPPGAAGGRTPPADLEAEPSR